MFTLVQSTLRYSYQKDDPLQKHYQFNVEEVGRSQNSDSRRELLGEQKTKTRQRGTRKRVSGLFFGIVALELLGEQMRKTVSE
jgi:hypothetical protein